MYAIATLMNKDGTYDSVGMNNRRPITGLKTQKGIIKRVESMPLFKRHYSHSKKDYKIEFYTDQHSNEELCHLRYYSTPKAALGSPTQKKPEVIRGMGPHCLQCDAEMSPHAQVYTVTDKPTGKTKGWVHVECRDEYENIVAYEVLPGPSCLNCGKELKPSTKAHAVTDLSTGKAKGFVHTECFLPDGEPKDEYEIAKERLEQLWACYVYHAKKVGESYGGKRVEDFAEWLSIELKMSPE